MYVHNFTQQVILACFFMIKSSFFPHQPKRLFWFLTSYKIETIILYMDPILLKKKIYVPFLTCTQADGKQLEQYFCKALSFVWLSPSPNIMNKVIRCDVDSNNAILFSQILQQRLIMNSVFYFKKSLKQSKKGKVDPYCLFTYNMYIIYSLDLRVHLHYWRNVLCDSFRRTVPWILYNIHCSNNNKQVER